jgi:hypothetical protein
MVYEWDARRARRAQLGKIGFALIAACGLLAGATWLLSTF